MKREDVIEKWAEILYLWGARFGVEQDLTEGGELIPWKECSRQEVFRDTAREMWEVVG